MGLSDWFKRTFSKDDENLPEERQITSWPGFGYDGTGYLLGGGAPTAYPDRESDNSNAFVSAINTMYKANSFVFSVMDFRRAVFSQIDFALKPKTTNTNSRLRPADLIDHPNLDILRYPWVGGNTTDLLNRMITDVDLCGNSFVVRQGRTLQRLRPDSVTVIFGSHMDPNNPRLMPDAQIIGYIYSPKERPEVTEVYLPEEMCHWAPLSDPDLVAMGMSWLTPLYKDISTDESLRTHVIGYLKNGANPGTVLSFDPAVDEEKASRFLTQFQNRHAGAANAYKTLILGGGATEVSKISADLQSLSISQLTAVTESRIAEAGGVHPMLLGTESALKHGSFNAIQAARRVFADRTMRPLWKSLVEGLETLVRVPNGKRLWYDDTAVPFLREDTSDRVKNLQTYAITIRQLIDAGFKPESVIEAVTTEDLDALDHTDLYSVQLRPPLDGTEDPNSFPSSTTPVIEGGDNKDEGDDKEDAPERGMDALSRAEVITYSEIRAREMKSRNEALRLEIENRKLTLQLRTMGAEEDLDMQECRICQEIKPMSDFYRNTGYASGRDRRCILCVREENRNRYKSRKTGITSGEE